MTGRPPGPPPHVVPASLADLDVLGRLIADAFQDLPPSRWLIADPAARRQILPGYFRLLAILAVQSGRQGQGAGTALLRAYHDTLDRHQRPAYLEAAEWRSRQFYRRHGYLPSGLFYLPGGGPAMWPMWRPPRPATAG